MCLNLHNSKKPLSALVELLVRCCGCVSKVHDCFLETYRRVKNGTCNGFILSQVGLQMSLEGVGSGGVLGGNPDPDNMLSLYAGSGLHAEVMHSAF